MPTIDLDGVTLSYADEGIGEPVVLVHGFPLSSELWRPQRAALSASYRVLTPDLRGFGSSDPPYGAITVDTYADDLVALLDALGVGAATFAGLSMGGYILMALVRRHPERVRGLMLLATKASGDNEAGKQGRNAMIALVREAGAEAVAEKMLPNMLTARTREQSEELVAFVRHMMADSPVEGIAAALEALRDRPDSIKTLRACELPVLIVVGEEDQVTPPADASAMRDALGRSRLEVIPDAAHLVNLEQPEAVNAAMRGFLNELHQVAG
jgi:pimeloyl-ACP methyl ester carboxylesterase